MMVVGETLYINFFGIHLLDVSQSNIKDNFWSIFIRAIKASSGRYRLLS